MKRPIRHLVTALKLIVPLAIIGWLLSNITPEQWQGLRERPKNWPLLGVALCLLLLATSLSFARWWVLVRSIGIPFRLRDAFRLGFLGYLLNYVSIGAVGGDLFKAIFIAREQPGHRAEAVASVVVDRVIGLYGLLLLTSFVVVRWPPSAPDIAVAGQIVLAAMAVGTLVLALVMLPSFSVAGLTEFICRLPHIGHIVARLMVALRMFRRSPRTVFCLVLMAVLVHWLSCTGVFLVAAGLFPSAPSYTDHLTIVPLSMAAGALPFTPAGLGTLEFAMDELYRRVQTAGVEPVSGVTVAITFRLMTIAVAAVGVIFYLTSRAEIRATIAAAKELQEDRAERTGS